MIASLLHRLARGCAKRLELDERALAELRDNSERGLGRLPRAALYS